MAVGESGRIRVGTAYITITPDMDETALRAQLAKAEQHLAAFSGKQEERARQVNRVEEALQANLTARYGKEAAKRLETARKAAANRGEFNKTEAAAAIKSFREVNEAFAAQERAKTAELEKSKRQRQRINLNARNLEVSYGTDVANAYRANVERMLRDNKNLTVVRINEAKQWAVAEAVEAKKVAAEHARLAKVRETQVKSLTTLVIRQAQMESTAAIKAAQAASAAHTLAHNTRKAQILAEMNTQRASNLAAAQGALATAAAQKKAAQDQIKANNETTKVLQSNAGKAEKSWTRATYNMGSKLNALGTSVGQFGRSIQQGITTPMLTAVGAMTAMGVSAADSLMRAQTALLGMNVTAKDAKAQIETLEKYGTQTPYAVGDMFTYAAQYTRSGMSNGLSSSKASERATNLVRSIGDLAAYAGITDPEMVKRTMVAVGNIQEADRASLRNVRTLAQQAGFDIPQLAKVLGFKDRPFTEKELADRAKMMKEKGVDWEVPTVNKASSQMMDWMQNAKDTGGIPGESIVSAILEQAKKVAGTGTDDSAATRQGAATVTARLSNMWETAKFSLADVFLSPEGKDGSYVYDGAGEAIMGKRTPVMVKGPDNTLVPSGEFTYEGGLLETITEIGKALKGPSAKAITELFESLNWIADWVKEKVQFFKDNPGLTDMILEAGKWAAILGGGAIVLGGFIKLLGFLTKLASPLVGVTKGLLKLGKGGAKIAGQATGVGTRTDAREEARTLRQQAKQQAKEERKEAERQARLARRAARRETDSRDRTAGMLHANALETQGERQARETRRNARQTGRETIRQGREETSWRERYQQRRTNLNGGDNRSLGRRAWDAIRGKNSQTEEIQISTSRAEEQIKRLEQVIENLKDDIRDLKGQDFREVADSLAGGEASVKAAAEKAAKATRDAETAAQNLKGLKFGALSDEFNRVIGNGGALRDAVDRAEAEVVSLNGKGLGALDGEFEDAKGKAKSLDSSIVDAAKQAGTLNGKSLDSLRGQVDNVTDAAQTASNKFGSGDSSLISRVGKLNGLKTDKIAGEIKDLKKKLDDASGAAKNLDTQLNNISANAPGSKGTSNGSKKSSSDALGGVLPGYSPGQDIHHFTSPTGGYLHLSGGEAVMRPEWTAAVGKETVDRWNYVARTQGVGGLREEMKFANGGIIEKLGLGPMVEGAKNFNVGGDVLGATRTMIMDSTSPALGGPVQKGIIGAGTDSSHFIGGDLAKRFKGIYNFVSEDVWDLITRIPIPNGFSQVIGAIAGAVAPTAGEYFWNDVWKGEGNILERGQKYLDHMFSMDTLNQIASDLFDNAWGSVSGIYDTAKSLVTDPIDTISDSIDGVVEMARSQYDGMVSMVKGVRDIWQNPREYAGQVVGDIYTTAKESLPNLEGLFDFSGDGLAPSSKAADVEKMLQAQFSTPALGDSVTRWAPMVRLVLSKLGLPQSDLPLVLHRIKVESGGNPNAINLWDSNAKAGYPSQGLMQTIPQTFAAYAGPYRVFGITNPFASIYAGLNYATQRYGSGWRKALSGVKGYATGTDGADRGWAWVGEEGPELVHFKGGETVLTHEESMLTGMKVLRGYASGTSKRTTGIAADAAKGVSSLNSAVKKLYDLITKAFTSGKIGSGTASSLNKYVDSQNKQLQKLVKDRTDLATKLKDANAKLEEVKKEESEMATSIADKAKGLRSLTDVFNSDGVSTSSAISGLKSRLAAIKAFQSNVSKLVSRGFSKEIISEIAQAGPEQGNAMATELLNATEAQVKDLNSTYAAIGTASDSLGKSVAGSYYSAGKKAAQSLVDGLTSKDKALTKKIEGLADSIIKTFKKKLKVSSKTPVNSSMASLLTWLTGEGQAVTGGGNTAKKKSTRVTTSYSTDSKGRKVTTVTTTVTDPAKGTTTTTTERTVGGKTTKSTKVSKIKGYWTGTRSAAPGVALVGERGPELVNFRGGESVRNAKDTAELMGPRYEIHIHEAKSENTTQSVLRAMQYAEVMANM